jgi:hypothetical protein
MFLGTRPASGTRIGTAAWPYNALPFLVTYGVLSALSRRFADFSLMWIAAPWGVPVKIPTTRLLARVTWDRRDTYRNGRA